MDNNIPTQARLLNQSAVKQHALRCSKQLRAGAFERVSQEFLDDIQSCADNMIREINAKFQPPIHAVVGTEEAKFVTGELMDKAQRIFNDAVGRLIQAKVQRHPSIGKTLKT
jgi:hypothetical protein